MLKYAYSKKRKSKYRCRHQEKSGGKKKIVVDITLVKRTLKKIETEFASVKTTHILLIIKVTVVRIITHNHFLHIFRLERAVI